MVQLGIMLSTELDPETVNIHFKKKVTCPWKEKEIVKILQSIEKFKTLFNLVLSDETLQVVRVVQENVKDISESIQKIAITEKHKSILK